MKDYYRILNVASGSSQAEIKRAYRKLVQQVHPDVNPDPRAHDLIKEVNEAYETLGNEVRRRAYDHQRTNPIPFEEPPAPPKHRDPAYRRQTRPTPRAEGISQQEVMAKALPYMKPISWFACLLSLVIVMDFFLPRIRQTETIASMNTTEFRKGWQGYIKTDSGRELNLSGSEFLVLEVGEQLIFTESALLKVIVKIQHKEEEVTNLGTLYRNFLFLPILLITVCGIWLSSIGTIEFRFNLGLVSTFLIIFTLIILFK
jgi:hypothetical protein